MHIPDPSPTDLPKTGGEDAFTHRQWVFYVALGSVCLLAIIQFAFFPPHTTADRAMSVGQSKEQLARARTAQLRQAARKKQDDQDFLQLVNSANNARGVKVTQTNPKGNQPTNQNHTENPKTTSPEKSIASTSTPPVVGSSWGKEPDPILRNFSRWADNYANAPEAQRQAMAADGLRLAAQRREIMRGLIQNNPQAAIAYAIPVWRAGEIPLDIRQIIEKRISGIGDLDVLGVTPARNSSQPIKPVQRTAHFGLESYEASVYGRLATVGSQMDISMHGIAIEDQVALMDSQIELIEPGIELDPDKEFASSTTHPIDRMLANRGSPPRVAGADAEPVKYEYAQSGDKLYCLHCSGAGGWQSLMANVGNAELAAKSNKPSENAKVEVLDLNLELSRIKNKLKEQDESQKGSGAEATARGGIKKDE